MKIITLQSGSNGNCFYVEAGDVRLLFDAGITGRQAETRLAEHGRDIRCVDALFISHDHRDHSQYMGVYHRKYGMPVYVTDKTLDASRRGNRIGAISDVKIFEAGSTQYFGDVSIHSIPTPHDSAEGVAFVVEDDCNHRVGILTDLGHAFDGLRDVLRSLDAVIIESNYDSRMLQSGGYPEMLKRRITGRGGHLSNEDSAQLLAETIDADDRQRPLKWACLCHLSEDNNRPEVARETHENLLGDKLPIYIAKRDGSTQELEV